MVDKLSWVETTWSVPVGWSTKRTDQNTPPIDSIVLINEGYRRAALISSELAGNPAFGGWGISVDPLFILRTEIQRFESRKTLGHDLEKMFTEIIQLAQNATKIWPQSYWLVQYLLIASERHLLKFYPFIYGSLLAMYNLNLNFFKAKSPLVLVPILHSLPCLPIMREKPRMGFHFPYSMYLYTFTPW